MKCDLEARRLDHEELSGGDDSIRILIPGSKLIIGLVGVEDHVEYDHVGNQH